jgi:hypothetical protein
LFEQRDQSRYSIIGWVEQDRHKRRIYYGGRVINTQGCISKSFRQVFVYSQGISGSEFSKNRQPFSVPAP